jgi:hypothetical protein
MNLYEQLKYLHEKLDGETTNTPFKDESGSWSGKYKGKNVPDEYTIMNFGDTLDELSDLLIGHKYNIYLENYDHWFVGFKFVPVNIKTYRFKFNNSNETPEYSIKQLYAMIKKGLITNYIA